MTKTAGIGRLELFLVIIRLCLFELRSDLVDTCLDCALLAFTVNDDGAVLVYLDLVSLTELLKSCILEL